MNAPHPDQPRERRAAADLSRERTAQLLHYQGTPNSLKELSVFPRSNCSTLINKDPIFFAESDLPLSGVAETASQSRLDDGDSFSSEDDDDSVQRSKEFTIPDHIPKGKKTNSTFRRVRAAPWMIKIPPRNQIPGFMPCEYKGGRGNVPCRIGERWDVPLNGKRNWITWTSRSSINELLLHSSLYT